MDLNIQWKNLFRFAFVGVSGAVLNLFILWTLTNFRHLYYLLSAVIAIEISILWNFALNTKLTFNYKFKNINNLLEASIKYHMTSFVGILINLFVLQALTELININYIFSEMIAILLAFGVNYILSVNYIWSEKHNF
jgi:dolichol-phosphate mannosyltransferase